MSRRVSGVAAMIASVLLFACSSGESANSPPPAQGGPSTPTGLSASAPSSTSVSLTWNGSSEFTGYKVFRNDIEIATATSPNFTDTGLTPSTVYRYFVRGQSSGGLSAPSATVAVTTPNMLTMSLVQLVDPASRSFVMVRDVEFDSAGNIFVTSGAYQAQFGGGSNDGVVSILSADGSSLIASTFFGGSGFEDLQGVEFAPDGLLYISGGTQSSGLRTTSNAFRPNFSGVSDAFLAALTPDLKGAPYLSYLGGTDTDTTRALDIAQDGFVALGGITGSPNFPVSAGGSTAPAGGATTGWWALLTP